MANWSWKKQSKASDASTSAWEKTAKIDLADLEIEKKWLRLARIQPSEFEFFYKKYYDPIMCFINADLRNNEVAQELTNEVFSVALDRLHRFRWQGYSFGAWLFQIARYLVAEENRRRIRSPEVPWGPGKPEAEDPRMPDDGLHQSDDERVMNLCISQLDIVRRQVIQAHYWTGLKVKEIAIIMELSEGNVKNHLQRGRGQLLNCLLENGMEHGISAEKMKLVKEMTIKDRGWEVLGDGDPETSQ